MNPALASIERAMARSELHNDPMHCVLEAMHDTIVELTTIRVEVCRLLEAARNPVDIDRLARCAALGANEQALALVRTMEARNRWRRLTAETLRAALYVALGIFIGKVM